MDFSSIPLFSATKIKMDYSDERQAVLSKNVANIDTPGYTVMDLRKLDFRNLALATSHKMDMRLTNPAHITTPKHMVSDFRDDKVRKTYELNPVKNGSSVEEEMMKVAQNTMDHQMATTVYRKSVEFFKIALGRGGAA